MNSNLSCQMHKLCWLWCKQPYLVSLHLKQLVLQGLAPSWHSRHCQRRPPAQGMDRHLPFSEQLITPVIILILWCYQTEQNIPSGVHRQKVLLSPSIAIEPSFVAGKEDKPPRKLPIGVRATPTTHTSVSNKGKVTNCSIPQNHLAGSPALLTTQSMIILWTSEGMTKQWRSGKPSGRCQVSLYLYKFAQGTKSNIRICYLAWCHASSESTVSFFLRLESIVSSGNATKNKRKPSWSRRGKGKLAYSQWWTLSPWCC